MDAGMIAEVAAEVTAMQELLFDAQKDDTDAAYMLEDAKAHAISDGQIVGKNSEEREAKAVQVLADYIGAQRVTKAKVAYAKMLLDRAVMNWERVKYTIRLMEVTK